MLEVSINGKGRASPPRVVLMRYCHPLAITIAEFPFHPAVEQGGRETATRGGNAADRRPSRSGFTGHDADISGIVLICKIVLVRGVTRDPRSRP